MRQVVTEIWDWNKEELRDILLSYPENHVCFAKKEREEIQHLHENKGEIYVWYWIEVANGPDAKNCETSYICNWTAKQLRKKIKAEKLAKKKAKLVAAKNERIQRYQKMVENGGEIIPTNDDINNAMALQEIIGRQIKTLAFMK